MFISFSHVQVTPYAVLLFSGAVISLLMASQMWSLRSAPGGQALFWFLLAGGEWSFASAIEAVITGLPEKIFWSQVSYIGVCSSAPLALIFALRYSRRDQWLTPRNTLLIWLIPVISFFMAAANGQHHLLWSNVILHPDPSKNLAIYEHGPWFWVFVANSYACLVGAALLFANELFHSPRAFRSRNLALLFSLAIPWIANLIYTMDFESLRGLDLTPVAFSAMGIVLYWAISRFQLFDLVPVARHALVENMQDGVLVIDPQGRIDDINPAARRLLGLDGNPLVGSPVHEVFSGFPELLGYLNDGSKDHGEIRIGGNFLGLRISPLHFQYADLSGSLVTLRDITSRKAAEIALEESRQKFLTFMEYLPAAVFIKDEESRIVYVNRFYEQFFGKVKLGVPVQELYPPEIASGIISDDQNVFSEGKQERIEAVYDVKGQVHIFQTTKFPIFPESKSRLLAGFGIDITQNKKVEEEERSQRILAEALRDTAAALNSTLNFDEVLERILSNVGYVVPYDLANIMLIDEKGWASVTRWRGYVESGYGPHIDKLCLPVKDTPTLSKMSKSGSWILIPDTTCDENWLKLESVGSTRSYLGAPVRVRGAVVGFINLDSLTPGFFNETHADRLLIFADQAAVAIENARLFTRMEQLAVTDALTGIYNRRHFFDLAQREVDRSARFNEPLSFVMIDIDHFKKVNDTYGHSVGDVALQAVARECCRVIREVDVICRYGGEEFVVMLPETDQDCAFVVADRMRLAISSIKIPSPKGVVKVTASLGIASLGGECSGVEKLLDCADKALYQAKQSGRNRALVYK